MQKEQEEGATSSDDPLSLDERLQCVEDWLAQQRPRPPHFTSNNLHNYRPEDIQAPLTMETSFQELYSILRPALIERRGRKQNASAIVQGARGSGKSLLVSRVLHKLQAELEPNTTTPTFRCVYVHGVSIPGHSIGSVVREILRQLSDTGDDPKRKELLRLKHTSFTNQLALLTEMIQLACVDGIPILFVIDELDTLLTSKNDGRQLLLYHLLERVASEGSLCSLIGMTSDVGFLTKLEKRIKSRAEGTTRFLFTGPVRNYDDLIQILCGGLTKQERLRAEVMAAWSGRDACENRAREQLTRDHSLGKSVRYFFGVLEQALCLYRLDLCDQKKKKSLETNQDPSSPSLAFTPKYLEEALGLEQDNTPVSNQKPLANDPRLQALYDLTGPQLIVILAARRILFRDSHSQKTESALTFRRIQHEYNVSYKAAKNYTMPILRTALLDLLEIGLVRPALDHSGFGPFRYQLRNDSLHNEDFVERMPLHLTLDINREIKRALDDNRLNCAAAVREWGRKTT